MIDRNALLAHLESLLQPNMFRDYCPNGLQVEGKSVIRTIVSGVTASQALIEAAVAHNADAILVHHGLFWRGYDGRVTGWLRKRLGLLLGHDINLLAYHLPLDAHPEFGNNAQLGRLLGLEPQGRFGEQQLGWLGSGQFPDVQALAGHVERVLGRTPMVVPGRGGPIARLGWCSGGAQGYFEDAIAAGVDAFLTGEISEPQAHLARECGVAFLACGHHATERYGVTSLAAHVATQFGLRHVAVDIDNPA
ncbi:MAG: Nif3-like dinuclear metal center hexameric protein [Rhodoferax sp.]